MEWINVKDIPPPKDKSFLGYVLIGFHFSGTGKDLRKKEIHTCIWQSFGEKFIEHCNCSGYEHDVENIEILNWMPLPKPPKD